MQGLTLLILFSILSTFFWVPGSSSVLVDLLPRLDVNDSYLHMYPLFWTNFWYLPAFYFLMTTYFTKSYRTTLVLGVLYLIYVTELKDFNILNYTYGSYELSQFNNLLTNNLNKYHPFLFFLSTHFCFIIIYDVFTSNWQKRRFNSTFYLRLVSRTNMYLNPLSLIALTLGGVWAFQEASWGGFWNWDSSETFGLLFLASSLYLLHTSLKLATFTQLVTNLILIWYALITMYCFIQLNFDLISHNFGVKFLHLFSNSFFYKEVLLLNAVACYHVWWLVWQDRRNLHTLVTVSKQNRSLTYYTIFWWQLILVIILWVMSGSLSQLISYTMFSLFQVNWFNLAGSFTTTILVFYLYMLYWLTLSKTTHPFTYIITVISSTNLLYWLPVTTLTRLRISDSIHTILLWATTVNILAYKTNFLFWSLETINGVWFLQHVSFISTNIYVTCDTVFIDNYVQLNSTGTEVGWWVSNFISNSININPFFLILRGGTCTSIYQLTFGTIVSSITIVTPYVPSLLLFTVCIGITVRLWYKRLYYRF